MSDPLLLPLIAGASLITRILYPEPAVILEVVKLYEKVWLPEAFPATVPKVDAVANDRRRFRERRLNLFQMMEQSQEEVRLLNEVLHLEL